MTTAKTKAESKQAEAKPEQKEPVTADYRVLKAITVGNGQTFGPGDTLTIADNDPEWPSRRPAQLVKQGFLRLLEG